MMINGKGTLFFQDGRQFIGDFNHEYNLASGFMTFKNKKTIIKREQCGHGNQEIFEDESNDKDNHNQKNQYEDYDDKSIKINDVSIDWLLSGAEAIDELAW